MSKGKSADGENESFADLVDGVRPLNTDRAVQRPTPPKPVPAQRIADEQRALIESQEEGSIEDEEVAAEERLHWCKGGVERDLKRLRKGDFSVQGSIDLHGLTVPRARDELFNFLDESVARGWRCVRVIHGKGYGSVGGVSIIKGKTARWLKARREVLAYCSAATNDGGTGAVWVLLSRNKHSA